MNSQPGARPTECEIDLTSVETRESLHELLRSSLGFPDWYGKNWDAFWDCLRDPDLSSLPRSLKLRGSAHLAEALPREYRLFRKCLEDLNSEYPDRAVVVAWA